MHALANGDGEMTLARARSADKDGIALFGEERTAGEVANQSFLVLPLDAGGHDLVIGAAHAVEFQVTHQGENVGSFHVLSLLKLS
jgi:hypothetical protein